VVVLRSLYEAIGEYRSKWELAEDVPAIEREWLGVGCGPLDPYAVAASRPGRILDLDCAELNHEFLTLPDDVEITTEPTGITRTLADTPYNERVAELARALAELHADYVDAPRLVDLDLEAFERAAPKLSPVLARRARHVITESRRVEQAVAAIETGDMEALGRLMTEGHRSLARDFESSLPAIDAQVEQILGRPGVLGARLQGAGWGGRIVVLRRSPAS
jgi:galactokinase